MFMWKGFHWVCVGFCAEKCSVVLHQRIILPSVDLCSSFGWSLSPSKFNWFVVLSSIHLHFNNFNGFLLHISTFHQCTWNNFCVLTRVFYLFAKRFLITLFVIIFFFFVQSFDIAGVPLGYWVIKHLNSAKRPKFTLCCERLFTRLYCF